MNLGTNQSKTKRHLLIAGGSGFLGTLLAGYFVKRNWDVIVLSRQQSAVAGPVRFVRWDGENLGDWTAFLESVDAVVNLAGRSVDCRYHARNRRLILDSRVNSTRVLGEAIARCAKPPRVWLNSSTATIYKHTFGPPWDEAGEIAATLAAKDEFSVEVARAWEKAFDDARPQSTRKVALRSAMVLGQGANSVFPVLRRLVRLGLGGKMASGQQFVSWIHELDFCRAVEWLIQRDDFRGAVNLAAPHPLPNHEMMSTLREVCSRPLGMPSTRWMLEIGAFLLRTETELILKSRRVIPGRLRAAGFQFQFERIRDAFVELSAKAGG